MAYRRVFVSSIEIWILSLSQMDPWNFGQSMKDEMREEANMPGASQVIIGNILVLQEQIDPPAWSPVQEALERDSDANPSSYLCERHLLKDTMCTLQAVCVYMCARVCGCLYFMCVCDAGAAKRDSDANYPWMRDIYRDASRLPQWMNTSRPVKPA